MVTFLHEEHSGVAYRHGPHYHSDGDLNIEASHSGFRLRRVQQITVV